MQIYTKLCFITLPQAVAYKLIMPSLTEMAANLLFDKALVKISIESLTSQVNHLLKKFENLVQYALLVHEHRIWVHVNGNLIIRVYNVVSA